MPPPLAGDFAVNVSMVYDLPGVRVPPKQLDGMGDNNLLICAECEQSVVLYLLVFAREHHVFRGTHKTNWRTSLF
jgi:hypothetical protein